MRAMGKYPLSRNCRSDFAPYRLESGEPSALVISDKCP